MALATQCPHCGTMFRVASDQLKLRGGIVRCGACQEIFDGSASLVDLDALPVRAPAAPAAPEAPAVTETPAVVDVPAVPEITEATEATETPEAPADVAATSDLPVDADTPAAVAPEPESAPEPEPVEEPAAASAPPPGEAETAPNFDDQPVYTLDFDHTFDPFGILPKVAAPDEEPLPDAMPGEAEPQVNTAGDTAQELTPPAFAPATEIAYPPSGRIEPSFDLPVDEEIVATALPDHDHDQEQEREPAAKAVQAADVPAILPMREAAGAIIHATAPAPSAPPVARTPSAKRADKAAARRSRLTPTRIDAPPKIRVPESDEPEFVKRSRQQEQSGRTRKIAMLAGSIVLLLILLAQGAFTFRSALAARFPGAKLALVSGCALFGCRVDLPAQVDNLVIDTGELTTLGGGAYAFTTQLRNQGAVPQAWPSLELSLTDANDKPLVRRVFAPRDYLAATTQAANGLAPRVEQAITLHFRVDDLQPSGYHIAVFYP
jgi:predicted Zn finger-like uncharacterized protein